MDILELFALACELIGLRYRRPNRVIISIARRPDVARLDAVMGRPGSGQSQGSNTA